MAFESGALNPRLPAGFNKRNVTFTVDAEFWFQPISFRWANNLKSYDAFEPKRFTCYYDSMASGSAVLVTKTIIKN